jgi:glycosyltransferase involved in cell wall biosynthesis
VARDRPRLLFVCHNHPSIQAGGVQGYALALHDAIKRQGRLEPVFVARTGPPATEPRHNLTTPFTSVAADPNQYLFYTDLSGYDWLYGRSPEKEHLTRFFAEFLRSQRPDIVHFQHTLFIGYDVLRVTRNALPDVPIVYTLHEYLPICHRDGQMVRTIANELCDEESPRRCHECFPETSSAEFRARKRFIQSHLRLVDLFITPSEHSRDRYVEWGIPADKIRVEACPSPSVEPREEADERPRNRFGFFGQFTPYKGADVLLEAMDVLGERFDGHLFFHGGNLETQRPDFKARFEKLLERTRNTVTFGGPYERRDLGDLMGNVDWVVVPSIWWETGPLVVHEAFQCRRPVICSDIGGMSEKVTDNVNGLHFRRANPTSLAEKMRRAASEPGLWEQLRCGIPSVPSMDEHAEVMVSFYDALLERPRSKAPAREPTAGLNEAHASGPAG